ncbi:MAG: hypothetical protein JKY77_06480 [Rhizobiaceae bacterium]|nr:hypothetical protein [Rhizobiaceae bacterium]
MRIWVILDKKCNIVGFYEINKQAIHVTEKQQGNGIGSALVADTLSRIGRVSDAIGICAVLLDVFDDGDEKHVMRSFPSLPVQPLRLFMPIQRVKAPSG